MNVTRIGRIVRTIAGACALYATLSAGAAQSFRVPGNSGSRWVDTGLDLKPGARIHLAAKGQVDLGDQGAAIGPEGTEKFVAGSGYPAETSFRYGLVARLTQSRVNADDDLREQWAYGDTHEYCATRGGHLWLTVNDNHPQDNTGEFAVDVSLDACTSQSTAVSEPRGRFRATLNGFTVNQQTGEQTPGDGAGDEVFVRGDVFVIEGRAGGGFDLAEHHAVRSVVMGETTGFPDRERAGTVTPAGGLRTNDSHPSATPWVRTGRLQSGRLPLLLWEGELRDTPAGMCVIVIPTIWEWDERAPGEFGQAYEDRLAPYMLDVLRRYGAGFETTHVSPLEHTFDAGQWHSDRTVANIPIGRSFGQVISDGAIRDAVEYEFNMRELTLTYQSARAAARDSFAGVSGIIAVPYADRWITGAATTRSPAGYTLYVQIESVDGKH